MTRIPASTASTVNTSTVSTSNDHPPAPDPGAPRELSAASSSPRAARLTPVHDVPPASVAVAVAATPFGAAFASLLDALHTFLDTPHDPDVDPRQDTVFEHHDMDLHGGGDVCQWMDGRIEASHRLDWDGKLAKLIVTFPGKVHEVASHAFFNAFHESVLTAGLKRCIVGHGTSGIALALNSTNRRQPDGSWGSTTLVPGTSDPEPTVVLEVAVSQTSEDVKAKCEKYLKTTTSSIRLVIVIKISLSLPNFALQLSMWELDAAENVVQLQGINHQYSYNSISPTPPSPLFIPKSYFLSLTDLQQPFLSPATRINFDLPFTIPAEDMEFMMDRITSAAAL